MNSTQKVLRKRRGEPAATETAPQEPETPSSRSAEEPAPQRMAGTSYQPTQAPAAEQAQTQRDETERERQKRKKQRTAEGA